MRRRGQIRKIAFGSCSVILLLVGPAGLLVGNQLTAKPVHKLAMYQLSSAAPAGSSTTVAATIASVVDATVVPAPPPAPPAPPPVPASAYSATVASWYSGKPDACYDGGRRSSLPPNITVWAASRTLKCGTTIEISGPAGTARMQIEDHGPWLLPGRDLDLSPGAFTAVAGSLGRGLVTVRYRVVPT